MGIKENKDVVRRQFESVNAGDVAAAVALWAPEGLNHGRTVDRAGIAKVYESLRALQEKHSLHEMIGEGDWVAVRTTCSGVHAAEPSIPVNSAIFTGRKPTGLSYSAQHIHLFRVVNGLIVEHWANRDDLGAAKATGLELKASSKGPDS